MKKSGILLYCAIAIILCISIYISIRPLFDPGYFPMHDDAQIARVVDMGRALMHGQFPVRLVGGLGYGYGYLLFNFYGPLPYYIGGTLFALGSDPIIATKIMMVLGIAIGSFSAFFLSTYLFGLMGGIFGSVLFTYFPYRAVQLYVRGSIGELWATSFIPLIVLSYLWMFDQTKKKQAVLLGVISLVGVILSHTVYAYIVVVTLLLLLTFYWGKRILTKSFDWKLFILQSITLILALDCTAFFWLPALWEMKLTNVFSAVGPTANFIDHFVCPSQFWNAPWGYGGSTAGCLDGLSFKLGKFHVILAFFSLGVFLFFNSLKNKDIVKRAVTLGICVTLGSLFMMTSWSSFIWKILPYAAFVQYPWRLLAIVDVGLLLMIPFLVTRKLLKTQPLVIILLISACIVFNYKAFQPQYTYGLSSSVAMSSDDISFRASQVSDEYLPIGIPKPIDKKDIIQSRIQNSETISVNAHKESEIYGLYTIVSSKNQPLTLTMAWYPGWKMYINNILVKPVIERGLPTVIVSEGSSTIEIKFVDTPVRRVGNVLSIVSILLLLIIYAKKTVS